ncbi:hypothetical protein V5O48_009856 [Marasmius crinis-equi]|uniref:F-box domain-containing protein n=1 Tax=Marasmius crinis-equi TaxID=585013 RepID=A0ABR3FA02_9AGAR
MPVLPLELVILILRELCDMKDVLCTTSLVCRSWLPIARSLLFRHIRVQPLGIECQLVLGLCESPLETFSLARAHELSIDSRHHTVIPPTPHPIDLNCLLNWQSSDGKRTLTSVLQDVNHLKLSGLRWWTLDCLAKQRMLDGFRSVTKLNLSRLLFDVFDTPTSNATDDFVALLNSFPALEVLDIESIHLPLNSVQNEYRMVPSKLHTMHLTEVGGNSRVMECLTPCPTLQVLSFTCVRPRHWFSLTVEWAAAMAGIMCSAGESLRDFSLAIPPGHIDSQASPAFDLFLELFNLSIHPNLEYARICTDDPSFVLQFIERVVASYNPYAGSSIRSLVIPSLASFAGSGQLNYEHLDRLLQLPVFSKLQEIKFQVNGQVELMYTSEQRDGLSLFEYAMQRKISEAMSLLPYCEKRGILRAEVVFWYVLCQFQVFHGTKSILAHT